MFPWLLSFMRAFILLWTLSFIDASRSFSLVGVDLASVTMIFFSLIIGDFVADSYVLSIWDKGDENLELIEGLVLGVSSIVFAHISRACTTFYNFSNSKMECLQLLELGFAVYNKIALHFSVVILFQDPLTSCAPVRGTFCLIRSLRRNYETENDWSPYQSLQFWNFQKQIAFQEVWSSDCAKSILRILIIEIYLSFLVSLN